MTGLKQYRSSLVFVVALLGGAGCGKSLAQKKLYQVQGQVLINGKPARFVSVELDPETTGKGLAANGHTDGDGYFRLRTYSNDEPDGVAAGTYKVQIAGWNTQRDGALPRGARPTKVSPEVVKSRKTVEISGEDEVTIEVP
jgi:hypothetical protein